MSENAVVFKGTKEGLYVVLKDEVDMKLIKDNLLKKVKPSKKFFEGAKIVDFKGKKLTRIEYDELKCIMEQEYGMVVTGKYVDYKPEWPLGIKERSKGVEHSYEKLPYENVLTSDTLFVRATVRSGQTINYDGNIVIIGDINPGAHIKSTGSIIVMGTLRGVAHSGSKGDYDTYVAAFKLLPSQLRIGDIITRSPDGCDPKSMIPEIAIVKKGTIVVEPYLPIR